MADRPDVTVVIPTRNRPALVPRAVRSALAQTHENLEVVVVIDGPDPATQAALAQLSDPRLRVIELTEAGGAPAVSFKAVRAADGPFSANLTLCRPRPGLSLRSSDPAS